MIKASVLDVGHGSCTIIHGDGPPSIIDGGVGDTLLEFLKEEQPDEIDTIVISHADADHISGLRLALRSEFLEHVPIHTVLVNPAQAKETDVWARLVEHLEFREDEHGTYLHSLSAGDIWPIGESGRCTLEVLAPRYVRTLKNTNYNNSSGVVRIHVDDVPEVFLPADMDADSLDDLLRRGADMAATIAVFPHHGGKPAGDAESFARRLTETVQPEVTILSFSRRKFRNPNPEIMLGITSSTVPTQIGCTQLSSRCCDELPAGSGEHLSLRPAAGKPRNECCTGTVTFEYVGAHTWVSSPPMDDHSAFIAQFPDRLCRNVAGGSTDRPR